MAIVSYCDTLYADKLQGLFRLAIFQAQLNNFSCSFHQRVEVFGLGIATAELRHTGYIVAILVALDQHSEFSFSFHANLPCSEFTMPESV